MEEVMIKIENVSKQYKLGQIGGTTLREEFQRMGAKIFHKEDPTKKIGAKDYNKGETFMALNGVSFEVKKGERVGIIGHNGAGKSTLLKLLSRVTAPTGGKIGLNGRVTSMLEVGTGFHGELTGRENIYMNGAILGMTKKEIDAKMEDIIEFSECRKFIDTPVKRYSSGMYVKLAFSVAAHLDSEIMIMDEVLAVGDMAFQKKCLDKMNDVSQKQGRTILYVSHNMNTIRQLCSRVVVLDHGQVVFNGDVEEGIQIYSGKIPVAEKHMVLTDVERKSTTLHPGFEFSTITISDRNSARYQFGETIRFETTQAVSETMTNLLFRIIIYYFDGSAATMLTTKSGVSLNKNEKMKISFDVDTSFLAPGMYTLKLCAYELNGFGNSIFYDVVDAGLFNFEVQADESFNNGMEWNHNWWGHITSNEMQIAIK